MTTRDHAPIGSPCWVDLWTSDVDGSRALLQRAVRLGGGQEPSEEFGGYFMFLRNGMPIAGGMGDMGDMKANNTWKIYLATDDIAKTVEKVDAEGGHVVFPRRAGRRPRHPVGLVDPTGAEVGTWQPGTFPGFIVLNEHGAPSWFELHTRDFAKAIAFYTSVWGWETDTIGDTDEFRYATVRNPDGEGEVAGVMDSSSFLPDGQDAHWKIYWEVDDVDATVAKVVALGGSVETEAQETPYGRLAAVADPAGARFSLRKAPA